MKKISVIGAGLMGAGIAEVCSKLGASVSLVDVSDEYLKRGSDRIKASLTRAVSGGKVKQEEADEIQRRIIGTVNLSEGVANADLVIETVPEDMDLKIQTFTQLDRLCPKHAVLASNTSSFMISHFASLTQRPDKVVGMHFFNPVPVMKLVEISKTPLTSEDTVKAVSDLSTKMGKTPVVIRDIPGFFTSRFLVGYFLDAFKLLEQGAAGVKEIDTMCKLGLGHPMGVFELADYTGVDIFYHVANYLHKETGEPRFEPPVMLKQMMAFGYLGDPKRKPGSKGGIYEFFGVPKM